MTAWSDHDAPRLGAALAFYTILSMAPLLIFVLALVSLIVSRSEAESHLLNQVQSMVGAEGAKAVQSMIQSGSKPSSGAFASIIGIVTLLFGASGVFGELRAALNQMWDVKPKTGGGIWSMVRERFFSFGMVLAIGFLLLVSLVISAALAALGKFVGGLLPLPPFVLGTVNFLVSFVAISALFAMIFKYVPETQIAWSDVRTGAVATAFLFTVGKFLIGLYLGRASVGSAYGAAGSLIVFIVWIYYSAMVFFFGSEFTHVYAQEHKGFGASAPSERG